jgi:hypothetical protein
MPTRLQPQFVEHAYQLRTVQVSITEIRGGRQDLHDETGSGRAPLDDLHAKILAISDKSPFESAYSMAERMLVRQCCSIFMDPLGSNCFICIEFRIC